MPTIDIHNHHVRTRRRDQADTARGAARLPVRCHRGRNPPHPRRLLDRFPRLTFILGLLGGALPMLAERVARGYAAYPELQGTLQRPIADYFRRFYYDTVPYGATGIPLTVAFAGADRVVLGSDHPHTIGNLRDCTKVIEQLDAGGVAGADAARESGAVAATVIEEGNGR
ncbi:MAG: amidohydrolase family protein [Thermomicrobiales bacterium]